MHPCFSLERIQVEGNQGKKEERKRLSLPFFPRSPVKRGQTRGGGGYWLQVPLILLGNCVHGGSQVDPAVQRGKERK